MPVTEKSRMSTPKSLKNATITLLDLWMDYSTSCHLLDFHHGPSTMLDALRVLSYLIFTVTLLRRCCFPHVLFVSG